MVDGEGTNGGSEGRPAAGRSFAAPTVVTYGFLFALGFAPIAALGAYAYGIAASAVDELIRANNVTAATIARELVKKEFEHRVAAIEAFAEDPGLRHLVRRRDEAAARERLRVLVESHPGVVRAFVTDPAGLLWSDYPRAVESLGENFAYRDWFQGVSTGWRPYVSAVYRRNAEPKLLLVAIAAPVRDPATDAVSGIVVYQVTLDGLTRLVREVEVGRNGFVLLIDHAGTVAAHPRLDLQAREYRDYAGAAPIAAARRSDASVIEYADPMSGDAMLATAIPIPVQGQRWSVVAQQPLAEAHGPLRGIALRIGGAGVLLALLLGGLLTGLAGYHGRVRRLNARLGDLNRTLSSENRQRRHAEQALQAANDRLEERIEARTQELRDAQEQLLQTQKMEAIGALAGGIAHDFNNLLTVILGYTELLLRTVPKVDPAWNRINNVHAAGQRASALTRQLLAFSRKQVLKPEILDVNEVTGRMDDMLRRLIGETIDLHTQLRPGLHPVKFDPGQIEQIIMNLVVNARDAMPNGGQLTIETANVDLDHEYVRTHVDARPGPHVMIAITDSGVGMDAETRRRIFEPFFTTKELGKGTGLGLSTVYGIVKQSGGNIWVYSEPGRGSTFKVYLPRADDAPPAAGPRAEAPVDVGGSETILVVEDEDQVRTFIREVLEGAGYTVLDAADADRAVKIFGDNGRRIDLVLTDVVLPGGSGRALVDTLSARWRDLKVVFMSGYTDDAIVRHGVLDPGTLFLEKPITSRRLLGKIREAFPGGGGPGPAGDG